MEKDANKRILKMKIAQAKNRIESAKESLKDNEHFIKYVEGFSLMVNVDGKKVPVDRNTICFYEDNQTLIKAEIELEKSKIRSYEEEMEHENENN